MKNTLVVILCCAAASGAWAADKKADPKKAAAPAPKTITIPKDAVATPDGQNYTWTDKQGKKWIYAKTPFGVMKFPATEQPAETGVDMSSTKAIDKGDAVRFERPGPFGTISWEKKKTDLSADEQKLFDTQNAKTEPKSGQPE
jgi:hypothetical protein